jgi:hypothetical protein
MAIPNTHQPLTGTQSKPINDTSGPHINGQDDLLEFLDTNHGGTGGQWTRVPKDAEQTCSQ